MTRPGSAARSSAWTRRPAPPDRQCQLRHRRRERAADHRVRPAQPVPFHDQPDDGRGLDRRCRVPDLGGDRPPAGPRPLPRRTSAGPATRATASCPFFGDAGLDLCTSLSAGSVTAPYYTYQHSASDRVAATAAVSAVRRSPGWRSCPRRAATPRATTTACSSPTTPATASGSCRPAQDGLPNVAGRQLFANLARPAPDPDGGAVFLTTTPTGDLLYADYDLGEVRRIHYYGATVPPDASFTATAATVRLPHLRLRRERIVRQQRPEPHLRLGPRRGRAVRRRRPARRSSTRTQDLGPTSTSGLKVTNAASVSGTTTRTVSVGNAPPSVTITAPRVQPDLDGRRVHPVQRDRHGPGGRHVAGVGLRLVDRHAALPVGLPHPHHHERVRREVGDRRRAGSRVPVAPAAAGDRDGLARPDGDQDGRDLPEDRDRVRGEQPGRHPDRRPPPRIGFVGSKINVTAPATATHRGGDYTFDHWSDDLEHGVDPPGPDRRGDQHRHRRLSPDRLRRPVRLLRRRRPRPSSRRGSWTFGSFGKTNDVDWYRFKLTPRPACGSPWAI